MKIKKRYTLAVWESEQYVRQMHFSNIVNETECHRLIRGEDRGVPVVFVQYDSRQKRDAAMEAFRACFRSVYQTSIPEDYGDDAYSSGPRTSYHKREDMEP